MTKNEKPGTFPRPATAVRVAILYRKNRYQVTTGSIDAIDKFAATLGRFANHCASEGDQSVLAHTDSELHSIIASVILRSTRAGNGDRQIVKLRIDNDWWLMTVTPIFPQESK